MGKTAARGPQRSTRYTLQLAVWGLRWSSLAYSSSEAGEWGLSPRPPLGPRVLSLLGEGQHYEPSLLHPASKLLGVWDLWRVGVFVLRKLKVQLCVLPPCMLWSFPFFSSVSLLQSILIGTSPSCFNRQKKNLVVRGREGRWTGIPPSSPGSPWITSA